MKVLVVGSSGFLGGWVKKLLLKDNEHDVIELLEDIKRDLNNYDLEYRIQQLESKFSKDLSVYLKSKNYF